MTDDLYVVGLDFRQLGTPSILKPDAEHRMRRMQSRMDMFRQGWADFSHGGGGVMRVLDGVAGSVARIGMIGGGLAAAAGLAVMTHATISLNSELEKTTIALGTMFSAEGQAHNLNQGLALAAGTIRDMRADAARLPGEFEDLMNIFKLGAIPAFQSGLDINSWRELSSKVMATGVIANLGGGLPQVAREMTMLLQGRAGAHNVFGSQLGFSGAKAEAFNKLSGAERVKELDRVLSKYGQSIAVFEQSWDAASSTLVDNVKMFAMTATNPLFERIKGQVRDANKWFEDNREIVTRYAEIIGMRLGEAWDFGKAKVLEWGPVLLQFVDNASTRLSSIWTEIEPGVVRIGELLKEALQDPGTINKLITLGKIWLGLKGAGMLVGAGQAAWGMGAGAWGMGRGALAYGGHLASTSALLGGGAAAGAGGGVAAASGAVGGVGAAAALGGLAAAAASVTAAMGAWYLAGDQAFKLWEENFADGASEEDKNRAAIAASIERQIADMQAQGKSAEEISARFDQMAWDAHRLGVALDDIHKNAGLASKSSIELANANFGATEATAALQSGMYAAAAAAQDFVAMAGLRMGQVFGHINDQSDEGPQAFKTAADAVALAQMQLVRGALSDPNFLKPAGGKEGAAHHKGGGSGTKIQKVEIVVTSNQSPSRVAREVVGHLGKLSRTPTSSKYMPNFSGVTRR